MKIRFDSRLMCASSLISLAAAATVSAADYTWNGTNATWGSLNWTIPPSPTLVAGPTGSSNANNATISSGTVTFGGTDTFGGADTLQSVGVTVNSGATLASGGNFNTIWNLNLNGGTMLANGGYNGTFGAFRLAGTVTIGGSSASNISLGSGSNNTVVLGGSGTVNTTFSVADVTSSSASDLNVSTVLSSLAPTNGLIKTGAGKMTLSAANTYTGTTTLSAGTLSVGTIGDGAVAGNLGQATNAAANIVFDGGTLQYTGANATSNRAFTINDGKTATIDTANNLSFAGATGTATTGSLTKTGTGTLTLTSANTYTGETKVTNGTLIASVGLAPAGTLSVASGATFQADANNVWGGTASAIGTWTIAGTLRVGNNSSYAETMPLNVTLNGGAMGNTVDNATFGNFLNGGGTVVQANGTGNTISARVGMFSSLALNTPNSGDTLAVSGILGATAGGGNNGALTKSGQGTVTLSGVNTYTGGTIVNAGILSLTANGGNSPIRNTLTVNANGTVITTGDGTGFGFNTAKLTKLVINGGIVTTATQMHIWNLSGGIEMTGGTLQSNNGISTSGVAVNQLEWNSSSVTTFASANTATIGGRLNARDGTALSFTVANGAAATDLLISAAITQSNGAASLTKAGAGTLELSGTNTYTGATNVSAGKLTVSAGNINSTSGVSIGAGEFNYNSGTALSQGVSFSGTGGKLSGSGTITPSVAITAGNTLAPGNSIGTLSFGTGLTLAGTYSVELGTVDANPASSLSDRSVVTGALTVGGNLTLVNNAGTNGQGSAAAGAYRIATYTTTRSGTFGSITNPLNATLHEKVVYGPASGGGNVDLNLYRLATGSTTAVNLGKARVGDSFTGNATATNSATADGFSEKLNATVGSNAGDVNSSSGSASGVIAGASSSTINVGLSTTTSGAKSGTVLVSYVSDGTGLNNYTTTANGSQTVGVTGNVYELAHANLSQVGGLGELSGGPSTYNLDFGTGLALDTTYTLSLNLVNGTVNLFQDGLTGDYTLAGGSPFGTTAADFVNLLAGSANTFDITFNTAIGGYFTNTFTFSGTSIQSGLSDAGALGNFTINLSATAVPEPNVVALLGGLGMLALLRRRR